MENLKYMTLLILFSLSLNNFIPQEVKYTSENLEKDFINELEGIFNISEQNKLFKLYADSAFKINSGIFITKNIQEFFEKYKKSRCFNNNFYYDENLNFRIKKESEFLKLLNELSKEKEFYNEYLNKLNFNQELDPTIVSATNYYVKNSEEFSKNERLFLVMHYAAAFYTVYYYD